ncbi:MAG: N-6 DNA methylase, partial [Cyanobacteria bacterium P01_D01_bin.115]
MAREALSEFDKKVFLITTAALRQGGRAAVVIKNTFLSNSDNASRAIRRELLSSCNLHTVLDC